MNVIVDGLMTSYHRAGKGKPLVLLHGWGDSARTFNQLVAELKNDYELYCLDLPGFGSSQAPPVAWTLSKYADFVRDWIKKVGITDPYYLLGHSFGGAVAVMGTGEGSLKPRKLVLLAASGVRRKRPISKRAMHLAAKAGRVPLYLLPPSKSQKLRQRAYKRIGSDFMLVPHMRETFKLIVSHDVRPEASHIALPTLLIYGSNDHGSPVRDGQLLNRAIQGSHLEVLQGGHFLHQEEPEHVGQLISNFLEA